MQIKGNKEGYIIHKITDNNYLICKILKEYNTIEDAKIDLVKLLSNNITDKELIKSNK